MPNWTPQQEEVIRSDARRLICSAAAGSGKTAVMIERAVRFLREGMDPETMLIVTFTNAAAAEMREKLRKRLQEEKENDALRSALEKLNMMDISTIHSFCQHLIRQEFQTAQADPFFTVCDTGKRNFLFTKAFRQACNELDADRDPSYLYFKKAFTRTQAEEIVSHVYDFMMSLPDPFDWLRESCDNVPVDLNPDHPWFSTAAEIVSEKLEEAQEVLSRQFRMFGEPERLEAYREVYKADAALFHVKQSWLAGEAVEEADLFREFTALPRSSKLTSLEMDWKDRYQELRKKLKDVDEDVRALLRPDPEKTSREFERVRELLAGLQALVEKTADAFAENKRKLRLLDFADLEHKALRILNDGKTGPAVRARWQVIFVDECQDVSRVQDAIIQKLAGRENTLFMVGDVKQSIYRFRLADPDLFNGHMERARRGENGAACLDLNRNFRSRPEILETANAVFRDIMKKDTAELEYTDGVKLVYGRDPDEEKGFFPVQVDRIEPGEKEKWESVADRTAERMSQLRQEDFRWRDMVILMPAVSADGPKLAELLEKRGVPVFFDGGKEFYELPEVESFLKLVSWIDRPYDDEALISALKNPPFMFSEEELAQVRLADMGQGVSYTEAYRKCIGSRLPVGCRCAKAEEQFEHWRKLAQNMRMSRFLYFLVHDSLRYAAAGAGPLGRSARANLRILCRQAEKAEESGIYSLRAFLNTVTAQTGGDQRAAAPLAEGDDVVRIMTIHKSKGLQFPVVFLLGLDRSVKGRASSAAVCMDAELGVCLNYKEPERRVSRKTAADRIFAWKKEKEERAERIRLLYVAMTRAQERMVLVGVSGKKPLWSLPAGSVRVHSAETYLDLILPALLDQEKRVQQKESTSCAQASKPWNITVLDKTEAQVVDNSKENYPLAEWLKTVLSAPDVEDLWKKGPPEDTAERLAKKSVTSLLRETERKLSDPEDEETPPDKRIPARFTEALKRNFLQYPAFMVPPPEKRGAWRGTVFHRFLALADLDRVRLAGGEDTGLLCALKEEMRAEGILTGDEAAVLDEKEISRFFTSSLGRRLLASPEVRREWGFNLRRQERNLLLQGVVDCAFREGDGWILLDYKTDRVEDEAEFTETYRPQLEWYEAALTRLTGRPVLEKWLYALGPGKAFRIP